MTHRNVFELHSFVSRPKGAIPVIDGDHERSSLPWHEEPNRSRSVLEFGTDAPDRNSDHWVGINYETNCPCRVAREQDAIVTFATIKRRLRSALGMTVHRPGVLVNALPALDFAVLLPRDSVVFAPGIHAYVTERICPYVGAPSQDLVGKKCPFCRIPVTSDTQVVTCRCGVVYHHETEKSHPKIDGDARLNCLSKVSACLSCSRPVTLEEYLDWDPETFS